MSAQRSFYLNCKFVLLMLVSEIRFETSHKTSTEEHINVAEKCFSVKHLAKTFLGISRPLLWIIYRNFTNNNNQDKTCIIHVSLYWDCSVWESCVLCIFTDLYVHFCVCVQSVAFLFLLTHYLCYKLITVVQLSAVNCSAVLTSIVLLLSSTLSTALWAINLISFPPISPSF